MVDGITCDQEEADVGLFLHAAPASSCYVQQYFYLCLLTLM